MSFYLVSHCLLCTQPRAQPWVGSQQVLAIWTPRTEFHPQVCGTIKSGVSSTALYLLENSFPQEKQISIPITFVSGGEGLLELHWEWQDMGAKLGSDRCLQTQILMPQNPSRCDWGPQGKTSSNQLSWKICIPATGVTWLPLLRNLVLIWTQRTDGWMAALFLSTLTPSILRATMA